MSFFPLGWACYLFFIFFKILVKKNLGFFFLPESRTNNETKFNFIGIKKIESVPKFFLKGVQIDEDKRRT